MDLLTLLGTLLRRWYVVLPTLLLTGLAAYMVDRSVPPEYEATGWVLIESPNLDQATGLPRTADILSLGDALTSDRPSGLPSDADFVVQVGETPTSFVVSASASTAPAAEQTVDLVTTALQEGLAEQQAGADVSEASRLELRPALPRVIPTQQSDGSFTASMPLDLRDPSIGVANPYGPNPATGRLLQVSMTGDAGRARFAQQFDGDVAYSVDQAARDAAALLQVKTTGADRQEVIAAFFTLQQLLDADLDDRQARAGVPESRRVRVSPFDAPLQAVDVSPPVERATAAVVLLGGLLAIGLGLAANKILSGRRGDVDTDGVAVPTSLDGRPTARAGWSSAPTDRQRTEREDVYQGTFVHPHLWPRTGSRRS